MCRVAPNSSFGREKTQVLAPPNREGEKSSFWEKAADLSAVGSLRKIESKDLNEAIQRALAELPPDFREAVILRDLEAMDYEAIASALDLGLGTVKSRIARGRSLLRERLKDWL